MYRYPQEFDWCMNKAWLNMGAELFNDGAAWLNVMRAGLYFTAGTTGSIPI